MIFAGFITSSFNEIYTEILIKASTQIFIILLILKYLNVSETLMVVGVGYIFIWCCVHYIRISHIKENATL